MGTFHVNVEIGDLAVRRWQAVNAVADTGATYTSVPADILAGLGVVPHVRASFVLADGRAVERDVGHAWIRIGDRSAITLVVFAEAGAPVLLGVHALEGLRLAADPVGRRLVPVPGLLLVGVAEVGDRMNAEVEAIGAYATVASAGARAAFTPEARSSAFPRTVTSEVSRY